MAELKSVKIQGFAPMGKSQVVSFFLGDDETQPTGQWISGQVEVTTLRLQSLALTQLTVLRSARDLIDAEIARMTDQYHQAEQSHG